MPSTSTDPRFLPVSKSPALETKNPTIKTENAHDCNDQSSSAEKQTLSVEDEELRPRKIPRYVPPKNNVSKNSMQPSRGDRHKVRKRIIVGNLSKWIPPEWRDDSDATHKWSMYVRGDKDAADISTYVSKVRFFLHHSYSPNDVVEVTSYPFYLTRRGWGEFPLRVQLHFKNAFNKPLDIIHHLKLDRSYTGLQMLGSETLVDLWIYITDFRTCDENMSKNELLKLPATFLKTEPLSDDDCTRPSSARPSTSRLLKNVPEIIQAKKGSVIPQIYQPFDPPADLALVEESADVAEKAVLDDATCKTASNVPFSVNIGESYLDDAYFNIYHDHVYTKEQYSRSCRIVRDGNVTIAHFSSNEIAGATGSSIADVNEEKPVGATITSHKYNGDIQSSSDRQPTVANVKDTAEKSQALQESPGYVAFQNSLSLTTINSRSDRVPAGISENIAKGTTTTTNGYCKLSDTVLNRLKNLQGSTNTNISHLQPLKISIPPLFVPSTGKRILLMKDKSILIPMNNKKSSDGDIKDHERNNCPTVNDFTKLKIRTIPQGTSILKKQFKVDAKNAVALKSGLLWNANYSEPALKIADSRDPRYNYSLSDAVRGICSSSSSVGNQQTVKSTDKDEKTTQRTKITLGKDKHKLHSKEQLYEEIFRSIDSANITDIEAFVRFIFRRLPIITENARDPEYRRLHPYACCSENNFFALSIGKQRALEWYRAKMVKSYLRKKMPQNNAQLWSVKEILMWARLHGYTPNHIVSGSFKMNATGIGIKRLADCSTCTEPVVFHKWLQDTSRQESSHQPANKCVDEFDDTEIDVVTVDKACRSTTDRRKDEDCYGDTNVVSSTLMPLELDESLMPLHRFVCDTAQEIGIKIAPEEIVPGVVYCSASRVIIRVSRFHTSSSTDEVSESNFKLIKRVLFELNI